MAGHALPAWAAEGLRGLGVERELPKWPLLLAVGENVPPELGREICLRTAQPRHLTSTSDAEWREVLASAYGFTWNADGWLDIEERERLHAELGILDLEFLGNDRVTATRFGRPTGWCDWDGTIGTAGTHLDAKWPSLADLNREWTLIAEAFPGLRMTAQLATYKDPEEIGALLPFLTWDIEDGEARLRSEPGDLLRTIELPDGDVERGCSEETLRRAIAEMREKKS